MKTGQSGQALRLSGILLVVLLALGGCEPMGSSAARTADDSTAACIKEAFEGSSFTHCLADPQQHAIALYLAGADSLPLRSFGALRSALGEDAATVVFAANAGMFDTDGRPIGLYVEHGKVLKSLNRNEGAGNFHLLPNGVFLVDDSGWQVLTTQDFAMRDTDVAFATQSGPMLVIDGKLHPEFAPDGTSINYRNGVGVDQEGRAHFVISDDPVSFGRFARFFRDRAETPNALYLDGAVSALWDPASARIDAAPPLGPLIAVQDRARTLP
ncbi:phosphodiester glycosidase family protein [Croceicoccus sp. F390]|uniref:Phosphodiester glycosidase family protein n=1 Tax=Croceicoccus esteveae TaxID=3075597 RepID=A0ABU2ZGZ7_9SPHN|nr:phosphodiester glycosidase family protein [Croceicoccus sp. F390]MDT0575481.1 phosphodiester glycosidase family protein [Croceicoccus sp. F390]